MIKGIQAYGSRNSYKLLRAGVTHHDKFLKLSYLVDSAHYAGTRGIGNAGFDGGDMSLRIPYEQFDGEGFTLVLEEPAPAWEDDDAALCKFSIYFSSEPAAFWLSSHFINLLVSSGVTSADFEVEEGEAELLHAAFSGDGTREGEIIKSVSLVNVQWFFGLLLILGSANFALIQNQFIALAKSIKNQCAGAIVAPVIFNWLIGALVADYEACAAASPADEGDATDGGNST